MSTDQHHDQASDARPSKDAQDDLLVALGNLDIVRSSWEPSPVLMPMLGPGRHWPRVHATEAREVTFLNRHAPCAKIHVTVRIVEVPKRYPAAVAPQPETAYRVERSSSYSLADRPVAERGARALGGKTLSHQVGWYPTLAEARTARDDEFAALTGADYAWDGTKTFLDPARP